MNDLYNYQHILNNCLNTENFIIERISKKIKWFSENSESFFSRYCYSDWKEKVIHFFYNEHLGLDFRQFGHIITATDTVLIIDWENDCPILKRALNQNVELRVVCSTLYSAQYQALLTLMEPGIFFTRDYSKIRPYHKFCREIFYYTPNFKADLNKYNREYFLSS